MLAFHYDRMATVWVAAPLLRLFGARHRFAIHVLMYHSVSSDASELRFPYYESVTDPDSFERQMKHLHRNNYSVLDLESAADKLSSGQALPEKSVVITFDDGYEDFLFHAWPVLQRYDFTATVFLPTAFI